MPREGKCGIYTKLKSFVPSPTWWERGTRVLASFPGTRWVEQG